MNIGKMKKVRAAVRRAPAKLFDMERFADHHPCGAVMCLAGHAAALDGFDVKGWIEDKSYFQADAVSDRSKGYLELDRYAARHVFYGDWIDKKLDDITKTDALRYLDKVIAAGDPMVYI